MITPPKPPHDPRAALKARLLRHAAQNSVGFRVRPRPLQDVDTWSHHTEAAFFEETRDPRTRHRPSDKPFADLPPVDDATSPPDKP